MNANLAGEGGKLESLFRLDGKIVMVTGAARGIGRASAQLCAEAGATIIATDREEGDVAQTCTTITRSGGRAHALGGDIASERAVEEMFDRAQALAGSPIDVLIHSAGVFPKYAFADTTAEQWDFVHGVNARGTFLCMREAYKQMRAAGGGSIVLISSISGERATIFHNTAYGASKAAVTNLARTCALEFGPDSIRVNAILPAAIVTEGSAAVSQDMQARGLSLKGPRALPGRTAPIDRRGTPEEIAAVALFLASNAASYVTGQAVAVDGGFLIS